MLNLIMLAYSNKEKQLIILFMGISILEKPANNPFLSPLFIHFFQTNKTNAIQSV